jgi:hypothetical protein
MVLWDVMPCSLVGVYRYFGEICFPFVWSVCTPTRPCSITWSLLLEPKSLHENFVSRIPEIMDSVRHSHVVISSVSSKLYFLIFCLFIATHIFVPESLSFIFSLKFVVLGAHYNTYIPSNAENTEASKNCELVITNQLLICRNYCKYMKNIFCWICKYVYDSSSYKISYAYLSSGSLVIAIKLKVKYSFLWPSCWFTSTWIYFEFISHKILAFYISRLIVASITPISEFCTATILVSLMIGN